MADSPRQSEPRAPAVAYAPLRPSPPPAPDSLLRRAVLFPQSYLWYVFVSSLDLMFTVLILHMGGREENAVAAWIIRAFNVPGLVLFKFAMVALVVCVCEVVGRRRLDLGRRLARWAVVLAGFPALIGAIHLARLSARLIAETGLHP